jgi:glycosyltransferase involved in cell wall biosynthesis
MNQPTRLIIQQPSLAKYRVPVFRELARYPDIDFKLLYGSRRDLPNAEPDGFDAEPISLWHKRLGSQQIFWHSAQWNSASPRATDVLMLTWNPRYLSLVPTLLKARAKGVPTILWGHGYSKSEKAISKKLRFAIAKMATALLFYNHTAAQEFVNAGFDPESIFVALNSLHQEPIRQARLAWQQNPARLAAFEREHHLGPGPHILFVSRLHAANRLDLLVEAVKLLESEFPHLEVFVIGKGEDEERRIRAQVNSLGLANRFRFLGPIYDEVGLAPWFLSSQVFCYPANIGLSLLHAFGYGLPVVTSDNLATQNPEIEALRSGENSLLYRDRDVTALASALRTMMTDSELAARLSKEAVRTIEEDFTIKNMVAGMANAVRYCAARQPALTDGPL